MTYFSLITFLSVFSVLLVEQEDNVKAECQLLEPINFNLEVKRNLSFSYCKQAPEIAVKAVLPPVKVFICT